MGQGIRQGPVDAIQALGDVNKGLRLDIFEDGLRPGPVSLFYSFLGDEDVFFL